MKLLPLGGGGWEGVAFSTEGSPSPVPSLRGRGNALEGPSQGLSHHLQFFKFVSCHALLYRGLPAGMLGWFSALHPPLESFQITSMLVLKFPDNVFIRSSLHFDVCQGPAEFICFDSERVPFHYSACQCHRTHLLALMLKIFLVENSLQQLPCVRLLHPRHLLGCSLGHDLSASIAALRA